MSHFVVHLPILPIIIPLLAGGLMILLKEKRRALNTFISFASVLAQLAVALELLLYTSGFSEVEWTNNIAVYLLGNWQAPLGIVLVADQLAALMLCLTAFLGLTSLTFSTALWHRVGIHFYPLLQFILMGLNGAFLTGDLFNLFVFFEVFLAASYGLLLHGSGSRQVSSGMLYVTINMVGASLLLIGISMVYSIIGTLNFAEIAAKAGALGARDRLLFETACSILGVAFLIKAAAWPLNFWLANAYAAASAPVAAMFAVMTKVGIYALLRVGSLLLPSGAPAAFGGEWMFYIGIATLAFGAIGVLAEKQIGRLVGYSVILSSGVLLSALGMPGVSMTGPSLYYLTSSVLASSALFLLVELISRIDHFESAVISVSMEAFGLDEDEDTDYSGQVIGLTVPGAFAFLGIAYIIAALVIIGLPPLSGFIGKIALLSNVLKLNNFEISAIHTWLLLSFLILSGLAALIAYMRTGILTFWMPEQVNRPKLSSREAAPIILLLSACVLISIFANPVMELMNNIALSLDEPFLYINAVMQQQALQGAH
ncbi:Na(+)/H(+) antiporter subunit D [Oligella sp. MSHR50489EDL]|uniref:monovalent cation/H+ antiporter subunit D n=1 Tax=Oligella sp. MSHR50489EDL TaxID=3139409 RepID=UPI003D81B149